MEIVRPENKFFVIGPGFQGLFKTKLSYDEYISWLLEKANGKEAFLMSADEGNTVIIKPVDGMHIVVMNEKAFNDFKYQQQQAAQAQNMMQLSRHGRGV